jgi:hypothetical protein
MKVLCVVVVALATVFGVNSLPRASSTHELAELAKRIPRSLLGKYPSQQLNLSMPIVLTAECFATDLCSE